MRRVPPAPITVRRGTPEDGADVARVLNEVIAEGGLTAADVPVTAESETAFVASLAPRGALFVAEEAGRVVGFQTVEPWSRFGTSMDHVASAGTQVSAAARGRGVGRALWAETRRFARAQGFEKVIVQVRSGNARALRFYRGLGFSDVGVARRQVRIDGAYEDEVLLECFLDA
jgi:L-amino acid N-acyltransferase YncA